MTPYTFLTKLVEYLKLYTVSGQLIFGDNVFLIPQFPAQQVTRLANPTCFVIDNGAVPFANNPNFLEQNFSVGYYYEDTDRTGDQVIRTALTLDSSLAASLRDLKTLNSEKVLLMNAPKQPFLAARYNLPNITRYWTYSVIVST